jgi:hypothetical protein
MTLRKAPCNQWNDLDEPAPTVAITRLSEQGMGIGEAG